MRKTPRTATILLALLAACACLATAAMSALGATSGGAAAPGSASATAAPVNHGIHSSGIATWFGPGFYGNKTACGQTLTPNVVGVANRTLPCGTLVKVSYGGRALTVPVLDRGPYSQIGADWDLTAGAAQSLGITETVRIHTKIVGAARNSPTLGLPALPALPAASARAGGAVAG
jgi:rare lipoprotein A